MQPDLSLFSLVGKTILVAGASRGIGLAIANGLAQAGATVVGFGRSTTAPSPLFHYFSCDVDDHVRFSGLVEDCKKAHGSIDGYFHVAGITIPTSGALQGILDFEKTLSINLSGAYACCSSIAQHMIAQNQGSIVTVTSIGSMLAFPNNPGYVASKGGLRMMSKAMAQDLGKFNVRVNRLVPGYIHTDMTDASYSDPEKSRERSARTMLGRWGKVDDLIGAAIFLASNASAYVTGTDIVVDGGWTAKGL